MEKNVKDAYVKALNKTLSSFSVEGIEAAMDNVSLKTDEGKVQLEAMQMSVNERDEDRVATVADWAFGLGSVALIAIVVICSNVSDRKREKTYVEVQAIRDAVKRIKLINSKENG